MEKRNNKNYLVFLQSIIVFFALLRFDCFNTLTHYNPAGKIRSNARCYNVVLLFRRCSKQRPFSIMLLCCCWWFNGISRRYPVGKITEKAVWRSVFLL